MGGPIAPDLGAEEDGVFIPAERVILVVPTVTVYFATSRPFTGYIEERWDGIRVGCGEVDDSFPTGALMV